MALNKKVSFEIFLDNNDWNEINTILPRLAKRRLLKQKDLGDEWCGLPDENFLELLENFNLSFAKEVDDNWNSDEKELNDIPGFSEAIEDIDEKVDDFIDKGNAVLKVDDFIDSFDFENWLCSHSLNIEKAIRSVLWDNRNNPLTDKIIQTIAKN